jgi:hypothetical protein
MDRPNVIEANRRSCTYRIDELNEKAAARLPPFEQLVKPRE